jgi:hypothetical protein
MLIVEASVDEKVPASEVVICNAGLDVSVAEVVPESEVDRVDWLVEASVTLKVPASVRESVALLVDTSDAEKVPESDVAMTTVTDEASVALNVPESEVDSVDRFDEASAAENVPESDVDTVIALADVSVTENVPVSDLESVDVLAEVSVTEKVPESLADIGVEPVSTDAVSVTENVPESDALIAVGRACCRRVMATREPACNVAPVTVKDIDNPALAVPVNPVQPAQTAAESPPRLLSTYCVVAVVLVPPERPVAVRVVAPRAVPRSVGMTPSAKMASLSVGWKPVHAPAVPVSGEAVVVSDADCTQPTFEPMASSHIAPLPGRCDVQIQSHEFGAVAPGVTVGAVSDEDAASFA